MISNPLDIQEPYRQHILIGMDEVGTGCIAGPVVACACLLEPRDPRLRKLDDSKSYTGANGRLRREQQAKILRETGTYFAIEEVDPHTTDSMGPRKAANMAMVAATHRVLSMYLHDGQRSAERLLGIVDGPFALQGLPVPSLSIEKADQKFLVVAGASILAKVYRDQLMICLEEGKPEEEKYGFEKHVGYPTEAHLQALEKLGMTDIHRHGMATRTLRRRSFRQPCSS